MELRTILLDVAMICFFIVIGLFWFDVIQVSLLASVLCFAGVVCGIAIIGSYFNHNYTKASFLSQGRKHLKRVEWYDNEPNQEVERVGSGVDVEED